MAKKAAKKAAQKTKALTAVERESVKLMQQDPHSMTKEQIDNLPKAMMRIEVSIIQTEPRCEARFPAWFPRDMTQRFIRIAIDRFRWQTKQPGGLNLFRCTRTSIQEAVIEAATYGLSLDRKGSGYFVPYAQNCTFMLGYIGMIDLAVRSPKIKLVRAGVIKERDVLNAPLSPHGVPDYMPAPTQRGDTNYAYASYLHAETGEWYTEFMTRDDIESIRQHVLRTTNRRESDQEKWKMPEPWLLWPDQMAAKSAIRRAFKQWPVEGPYAQLLEQEQEHELRHYRDTASTPIAIPQAAGPSTAVQVIDAKPKDDYGPWLDLRLYDRITEQSILKFAAEAFAAETKDDAVVELSMKFESEEALLEAVQQAGFEVNIGGND